MHTNGRKTLSVEPPLDSRLTVLKCHTLSANRDSGAEPPKKHILREKVEENKTKNKGKFEPEDTEEQHDDDDEETLRGNRWAEDDEYSMGHCEAACGESSIWNQNGDD